VADLTSQEKVVYPSALRDLALAFPVLLRSPQSGGANKMKTNKDNFLFSLAPLVSTGSNLEQQNRGDDLIAELTFSERIPR
jgi:hypothetical protein